jgi:GMP synthase PP-ATPase subunit
LKQIRSEFDIILPDDFEDKYREKLLKAFKKDLNIMPGGAEVIDQLSVPFCAKTNPLAWLEQGEIYGDLRQSVEFCDAFRRAHANVQGLGALGAIRFYLAS